MYFYHAHAVALGGVVERPSPQTIDAQAACALSISGGTSSASAGKFDNGLISFDSAQSQLTSSTERRGSNDVYYTGITVTINRLNAGGVFKADQIVARMSCEHILPNGTSTATGSSSDSEPTIDITGSHFDNLRIAGYPVTVDVVDLFNQLTTFNKCCDAWNSKGGGKGSKSKGSATSTAPNKAAFRECLLGKSLENNPPTSADPEHLQHVYAGFKKQDSETNLRPTVLCSFVKQVNGINSGGIGKWGPIIRVPQFGTIYLGEVILRQGQRHLNMFRLQLGSPQAGGFVGGSTGGNGGGFP